MLKFDVTVTVTENRYIIAVHNFIGPITTYAISKVIDNLLTDKEFVAQMDELDPEWWYNTDKIILDLC